MSSAASTPVPTPRRHARPFRDSSNNYEDNDNGESQLQRQLPAYEPPIAPLTPTCQRALTNLLQSDGLKALHTHIQHAGESVSDAAGEVNEKLTDARERHTRYLASLRKRHERAENGQLDSGNNDEGGEEDGDGDGGVGGGGGNADEEEVKFGATETQVTNLTATLEEKIRRVVDWEVMLENLKDKLGDLGREAEEAGSCALASSRRRARQSRRRRNADPAEDDDDEADEDYNDAEEEQQAGDGNEDETRSPPSQQLAQKLESSHTDWIAQSLTQRYANNNTYIGFYRTVHDAKHPGNDIPPIPHSSTWFRHLEHPDAAAGTATTNSTGGGAPPSSHVGDTGSARKRPRRGARRSSPTNDEDDEEVAIAHERISLKCPLTLLPFMDPVTSTKCPHSFEKEAILDMLNHSATTIAAPPGSGRNRRVKAVKCPVCEVLLSAQDLKRDVVLVRRVKRMQELMARADEDDEDDDEGDEDEGGSAGRKKRSRKGRQSGITLASDEDSEEDSGDETERSPVRIKQEKAVSQAP